MFYLSVGRQGPGVHSWHGTPSQRWRRVVTARSLVARGGMRGRGHVHGEERGLKYVGSAPLPAMDHGSNTWLLASTGARSTESHCRAELAFPNPNPSNHRVGRRKLYTHNSEVVPAPLWMAGTMGASTSKKSIQA